MPLDASCDHGFGNEDGDEADPYKQVVERLEDACFLDVNDPKFELAVTQEAENSWQLMDCNLHKKMVACALQMLKPKDEVMVHSKLTPPQLLNYAMIVLHIEEALSTADKDKAHQDTEDALNDLTCLRNVCRFFYRRASCACFDEFKG
jgi:hypothetical protein